LLHADLEAGWWLYRNPNAGFLTGLASVVELHYTSTLNDANMTSGMGALTYFAFSSTLADPSSRTLANRCDIFDLTVGLHADLGNHTAVRVGAAFPLKTDANRTFDSEVAVQLDRRF
jgi:hypothetical protein